jgi:hypothetical protein
LNKMAIKTKVNYSLRNYNGQIIWLPPDPADGLNNIALPTIFEQDSTQKYPLGTRYSDGECAYHYYYAGGAITVALTGITSTKGMLNSGLYVYGAHAAGVRKVKIDGTSAGSPVADYYAGGRVVFFAANSVGRSQMRIVSSLAAEATTPYAVELTLEQPTYQALADNVTGEIMPNRYANCVSSFQGQSGDGTSGTCPTLGIPCRNMTSGYYGWVQTWGPCFVGRTSTEPGSNLQRMTCFSTDGSIQPVSERWGATTPLSAQMAGYSLSVVDTGTGWIYLMIDP